MPDPKPTEVQPTRFALVEGASPVAGYALIKRLGRGGFGEVWLASSPGDYRVALKFLQLDHKAGQVEIKHLQHLKEIRHANLLSVFGAWEVDGFLVLAMELAHGTLADALRTSINERNSGIPHQKLFEDMRDAARGINYLNDKGIVHRDIKPANLLVVGDSVKVGDFGLAKLMDQTMAANSSGYTIHYAAPELFKNQVSRSVDQYALAVTYCELRGGRLPFAGNQFEVMAKHATEPPDLSMLPEAERPAVLRALAKKPEERWSSCREFVAALTGQKTPAEDVPAPGPIPKRVEGLDSTIPPNGSDTAPPPANPSWKSISKLGSKTHKKRLVAASAIVGCGIAIGLWGMLSPGKTKTNEPPQQPPAIVDAPKSEPKPPAPVPKPAIVRLKALAPVSVEAGKSTELIVAIERENLTDEVNLTVVGAPEGVAIAPIRFAPGESQLTAKLTAGSQTSVGTARLTVTASSGSAHDEQELKVTVRPAVVPKLIVTAPKSVTLKTGEETVLTVSVEREYVTGPVRLEWLGLPSGIQSAGSSSIPANLDRGQLTLSADSSQRSPATATLRASIGDVTSQSKIDLQFERVEPQRLDSTKGPVDAATVKKIQQQWADKLGMKVVKEFDLGGGVKLEMVLIPPGEYLMGSPKSEQDAVKEQYKDAKLDDEKQKRITIYESFYLAKTELTQEQYAALAGSSPSYFSATGDGKEKVKGHDASQFPVERVSWDEATDFCKKLEAKTGKKFKLPKEQEWEYACRAGTTTAYSFGAELNGRQANCDGNYPFGTDTKGPNLERTCKVGSYQSNALGLYDMHGNVWEWCEDLYSQGGSVRVTRGGGWGTVPGGCRAADRVRNSPDDRYDSLGFRPALVPSGQ